MLLRPEQKHRKREFVETYHSVILETMHEKGWIRHQSGFKKNRTLSSLSTYVNDESFAPLTPVISLRVR